MGLITKATRAALIVLSTKGKSRDVVKKSRPEQPDMQSSMKPLLGQTKVGEKV